jgi:lysophospholipid acyltransferase (LPLAT)-like uncharacterized protein
MPAPSLKVRGLALLLTTAVRLLYLTLKVHVEGEATMESLREECGGVILVTWHGNSLIPIARSRGKGYTGMVSLSRDGELLTAFLTAMRWRTIRGSSGRNGVKAAREALDALQVPGVVLTVTPDGPRGPARSVQAGVVFLARKSGKPIIPVGIGIKQCWRTRSWDHFLIPKPGSVVRWIYGDPIFICTSDNDIERACLTVEQAINDLDARASSEWQRHPRHTDTVMTRQDHATDE